MCASWRSSVQMSRIALALAAALMGSPSSVTAQAEINPQIERQMSRSDARQTITILIGTQFAWTQKVRVYDIAVGEENFHYSVNIKGRKRDSQISGSFKNMAYVGRSENGCVEVQSQPPDRLCWKAESDAREFVAAMNRMIWELNDRPREEADRAALNQKVTAWRASGSKVELPEEAQRHKVLAEEAFKNKNLQHAGDEYSAALQLYPTWPEGQYNVALILGELNRYSEAVRHMETYLQLTPDAPDAQKAKEQVWIWEDRQKSGSK